MKKVLSVVLATALLSMSLFGCGQQPAAADPAPVDDPAPVEEPAAVDDPAPVEEPAPEEEAASAFTPGANLNVMIMPAGDMNADTVQQVTDAVNARIAALGHDFTVEFSWSGNAWLFDTLDMAFQTNAVPDIFPSHGWSGQVNYLNGAIGGQLIRLDNPDGPYGNLLEQYGPDLYANSSPIMTTVATVNGYEGTGIYAYEVEKDSSQQLGFLVNETVLTELGFTLADFNPADMDSWAPLFDAYLAKYPDKFPFNAEPEVLDRTMNFIAYVENPNNSLGIIFDNNDIEGSGPTAQVISRYENPNYKTHIEKMHEFYEAGYIDPDIGNVDLSGPTVNEKRNNGDFLISSEAYAPGHENTVAAQASSLAGSDVKIAWVPLWNETIATGDTILSSGLGVSATSQFVPEAVTFLNMMVSDTEMANLMSEGVEGVSWEMKDDGLAWRIGDRAGWNAWRYGQVGVGSAATPLGDVNAEGKEWENFQTFNSGAVKLNSWVFNSTVIADQFAACKAAVAKYAIPLGSGAADPADYDAFIAELKAAGIDDLVTEAQAQQTEFLNQ